MTSWSGRTIGGCQVAEQIGRGGMAAVYRAYQPQLERWVAIKVLQVGSSSEEFLARFRREAKAIATLRHPNILTVYDYGEAEGVAYIVMEYVDGGTLKTRLTGEPMDWPDAAKLMIPVGRALAYAHTRGVIHRDVKPGNILLARPDWPLLADFGLAKLTDTLGDITQPGASLGTPEYLAPEQAAGEPVDQRCDVYGLGVVLYLLLTAQVPCQAPTPVETMLRRLCELPAPPSTLNPRIAPRLDAVVMRALQRDPDDRYPSMQGMLDDLCRLPGATGSRATEKTGSTVIRAYPTQPTATSGPRLLIVVTGAALSVPDQREILIGRSDPGLSVPPDIDLDPVGGAAAGVSRRHAMITREADAWLLVDLNSTNGTFLNEVQVHPDRPARLCNGDHVRFGTLATVFFEE